MAAIIVVNNVYVIMVGALITCVSTHYQPCGVLLFTGGVVICHYLPCCSVLRLCWHIFAPCAGVIKATTNPAFIGLILFTLCVCRRFCGVLHALGECSALGCARFPFVSHCFIFFEVEKDVRLLYLQACEVP